MVMHVFHAVPYIYSLVMGLFPHIAMVTIASHIIKKINWVE